MSKHEMSTPSADELKEIFSKDDGTLSVADGLVHVALGFYNDDDYVGLVHSAVGLGALSDLAAAEARLQVIHNHDNRKPGYREYIADSDRIHDRLFGVDKALSILSQDQRQAFIDEMEAEIQWLEAEQFAADNGLSDLDKDY